MASLTAHQKDRLGRLYYNPSNASAFAGVEKLAEASLLPRRLVRLWLQSQPTYSIHTRYRHHFPTNFYRVLGPDQLWECDLVITANIADFNSPFTCLLTVIDVFDKFAWVEPLRGKNAAEVCRGFSAILERARGRRPRLLQSDSGKEFVNADFQRLLRKNNIKFRTVLNAVKAAVIERFNRTLRDKLWRAFYFQGTYDFSGILQPLVRAYNNSVHSETGYAPSLVKDKHVFDIYMDKYARLTSVVRKPRFRVGQYVRLSVNENSAFSRGYTQKYTEEVFRIARVQTRHSTGLLPQPLYHLIDLDGDVLKGAAYQEELVPIQFDPKLQKFKIERVVERRKNAGGQTELFVKFLGYPSSMNKWIPESSVQSG